jgi:hypothetical protein
MSEATIIPFRPTALPAIGYRVDVHTFDHLVIVMLFQNRTIASQTPFSAVPDAEAYARELADEHRCAVIHHNHRIRAHCDCLSCASDMKGIYPCLIEEEK